jgi:hypothetical protein
MSDSPRPIPPRLPVRKRALRSARRPGAGVLSGRDDIASYRSSAEVIPGVRPALHIFVGSKAPWFDIADDLPQQAYR